MVLTRRIKKLKKSQVAKITGRQMLMCKECGNCSKEHDKTIDDSIDTTEAIGL